LNQNLGRDSILELIVKLKHWLLTTW